MTKKSFEELGGRAALIKVSKIFYDKIYAHPWIGQYFKEIKQEVIESQQVDFMSQTLGGPKVYLGKLPVPAHKHMMITDELFDLREKLLIEALDEAAVDLELKDTWLKVDNAFRGKLVKHSLDECQKRYNTDQILDFPNPEHFKKAA